MRTLLVLLNQLQVPGSTVLCTVPAMLVICTLINMHHSWTDTITGLLSSRFMNMPGISDV